MLSILGRLVSIQRPPLDTRRTSFEPPRVLHSIDHWCRKQEAPHPGARTPFDCCALTFQPFNHPVCARNTDGTGNVFELVSIIPWLKCVLPNLVFITLLRLTVECRQHNNLNPVTREPLQPSELITLHYSRKPSGEVHDPISFKPSASILI